MPDEEKMTSLEKYEFRRQLEAIEAYSGRATELISLYVPPTRQISDVVGYLRNEYSQSSNIKSKSTRKNVTSAIESIMSRLKAYKRPPKNGMVLFVGHVAAEGDRTNMVQHIIEPPMEIKTFLYRCDSAFFLEPLSEMIVEEELYGLIVVDRSEATVGLLKGKRIETIKNIPSRVPSKHGRGGQSQRRFERLIEIAAHEFFTKVGDIANESLVNQKDLKGILVGGPGATKDFFIEKDYLHHELKKKIIETFDTGYTNEYGLGELVEKASETLSSIELMQEKKLMNRFLNEVRKDDGGLSVYGEDRVLRALQNGGIDTLLVSEALRKYSLKLKCQNCGHTEDQISKKREVPTKTCPKCNTQQFEVEESKDIIAEYSQLADSSGTKFELISDDSPEGDMLLKAFGGIAGILRYKSNH
ncbi:MAG: peptide chain release factor aRF-1 [Thermoplasmata archaeon]|nr:peptide chain release factor aRF-1 [Thermoplasmata archaeon]